MYSGGVRPLVQWPGGEGVNLCPVSCGIGGSRPRPRSGCTPGRSPGTLRSSRRFRAAEPGEPPQPSPGKPNPLFWSRGHWRERHQKWMPACALEAPFKGLRAQGSPPGELQLPLLIHSCPEGTSRGTLLMRSGFQHCPGPGSDFFAKRGSGSAFQST
ncbi:hypothetical protein NDU88_003480 [Pleurodeles waltl]|uniref:Uncharacterized protein n=1 Tax=Pleurodeles waltl TaxID=8319 RepID=A0AAV7NJD0_PLEWA|nr:hypothetical protein NDU88_003480 [Pleurodeles waltl]